MKKTTFVVIFAFLAVCAVSAQTKSKPTPRSEVANPAKFEFLTINGQAAANATEPCEKSLEECGNERAGFFGYVGLGGTDSDNPKTETFTFKSGKKTIGIYLLTMMNNEDDSVGGERIRIAFEKKGNKWHYVQAGRQFKCVRGANTKTWTKNLCP